MYIPKLIVEMIPSWSTQTPSGYHSGFLAKYTNQVADDDSSEIWLDVLCVSVAWFRFFRLCTIVSLPTLNDGALVGVRPMGTLSL
jgi:hypothetical protein